MEYAGRDIHGRLANIPNWHSYDDQNGGYLHSQVRLERWKRERTSAYLGDTAYDIPCQLEWSCRNYERLVR